MRLVIRDARAAFLDVHKARAFQDQEPSFGGKFIIEKGGDEHKKALKVIKEVAEEKWKDKADEILKSLFSKGKVCLHKGEENAEYDGFDDTVVFINARNSVKPKVKDKDPTKDLQEKDGKPYSGCYVLVILEVWAQDNQYGKRINAKLMGVQFMRDGDAFSGAAPVGDDEFDDLSDHGDDDASLADLMGE